MCALWFFQILNLNGIFFPLEAINHAAEVWGIRCLRYEIRKCNSTVYCILKKGWGMVSLFQWLDFWSHDQDWDLHDVPFVLCSHIRFWTPTEHLLTWEYKWLPVFCQLNLKSAEWSLQRTNILARWSRHTPMSWSVISCFVGLNP